MGAVHDKHQTPYLAVGAACVLTLLATMLLKGPAPVDAFGYTGTFATFGFLVVYLLICIVAPLDLKRAGALKPQNVVLGIIGVLLMAFVIFGSVYPVPPAPYNLLPYLFAAYMVVGVLWYGLMKSRMPHGLSGIQADLEV
jgi:amino acid transporter